MKAVYDTSRNCIFVAILPFEYETFKEILPQDDNLKELGQMYELTIPCSWKFKETNYDKKTEILQEIIKSTVANAIIPPSLTKDSRIWKAKWAKLQQSQIRYVEIK